MHRTLASSISVSGKNSVPSARNVDISRYPPSKIFSTVVFPDLAILRRISGAPGRIRIREIRYRYPRASLWHFLIRPLLDALRRNHTYPRLKNMELCPSGYYKPKTHDSDSPTKQDNSKSRATSGFFLFLPIKLNLPQFVLTMVTRCSRRFFG